MNRQVSIDRLHIRLRKTARAHAHDLAAFVGSKLLERLGQREGLCHAAGAIRLATLDAGTVRASHSGDVSKLVADRVAQRIDATLARRGC